MKRDCGEGELIPVKFEVVWDSGMNDDENETEYSSLEEAKDACNKQIKILKNTNCSSVRLYAKDKKGYCNCILMWIRTLQGVESINDRTNEL